VFFDEYPKFYDTSETASSAQRLNLRHQAIIEGNRDLLQGARVLDLASHDGRWSFAALKAGAAHVTGVEARDALVDNAHKTFAEYGVPTGRYAFVNSDMFEFLRRDVGDVDVVLCLGFVYHTLRYGELFGGIAGAGPRYCILDSRVIAHKRPFIRLKADRTDVESHAAEDVLSHDDRALVGCPSVSALRLMLDVYGMDVEEQYDWPALLRRQSGRLGWVKDYRTGRRVTMRCRVRRA